MTTPRVLVVDDEPGLRFTLKTILSDLPATVFEAANGRAALEVLDVGGRQQCPGDAWPTDRRHRSREVGESVAEIAAGHARPIPDTRQRPCEQRNRRGDADGSEIDVDRHVASLRKMCSSQPVHSSFQAKTRKNHQTTTITMYDA